MRALGLAVLCALGLAPGAQADIAADFATAGAIFAPNGPETDGPSLEPVIEMVAALEGRWLAAGVVFSTDPYDADMAARSCGHVAFQVVPTGRLSFDLLQVSQGEPTGYRVSHAWVGGTSFTRSADLEGQLQFLFGDMVDSLPPSAWSRALQSAHLQGYATLFMAGPDVAIIQGVATPPLILTRCP